MKVSFRLSRPENEKSGVKLDFSNIAFTNNRFLYGCGVEVITKHWNPSTQRVRLIGAFSGEASRINEKLDHLQAKLLNYITDNKVLSREGLKAHLDLKTGVTANKVQALINKQPDFIRWASDSIKTNTDIRPNTKKGKTTSLNIIKKFSASVSIQDIDRNFFNRLMNFLDSKGYHQNTKWGVAKELKAQLRYAENIEGFKVNTDYRKGLFNVTKIDTDSIYLTEKMINKLEKVDISHLPQGYRDARNLWMFAYFTGFRYNDCVDFDPSDIVNLKGKKFIKKRQLKTTKFVFAPVRKKMKPYIKKHAISNPKANLYIKVVAALAGIKESEKITIHTARRSFCTNAYKADVPISQIMLLSGHKTVESFLIYIKISSEEHAMLTSLNPYFND